MPLHRTTAPCGSQQIPTQQCSAGGMMMMHLTLPASQQPQSHSPLQWKHNKYYSADHSRSQKPGDVCGLEPSRSSPQLGSSSSSPAQSPTPTHLPNVKSIRPSLNTVPIMPHFSRSLVSGQGVLLCQVTCAALCWDRRSSTALRFGPLYFKPRPWCPVRLRWGSGPRVEAASRRGKRCLQISVDPRRAARLSDGRLTPLCLRKFRSLTGPTTGTSQNTAGTVFFLMFCV
ncbi:R3H domain-containing protein 1-like isoform X2 [Sinocyclocheilus grahami]|uniref:R3H domain-containing protein 1-like isoform X2 n=1 Tax=Sinocyclocheilus grahami TaxID=75366 RepID=UPI0007AD17DB|nr:PREDICTED: R3H domain-containing protein 1-like isoform X2 [Sinocyclocheilus grahami]